MNAIVCGPHTSVPGRTECYEAVWSQGRACRTCKRTDCYRRGWDKSLVDADNKRIVKGANRAATPERTS